MVRLKLFYDRTVSECLRPLAVDMIVATTDTLKTKIPMLIVNPILSDDDIIKLIRFSKQGRLSEHSRFSTELTKAIEAVVKMNQIVMPWFLKLKTHSSRAAMSKC